MVYSGAPDAIPLKELRLLRSTLKTEYTHTNPIPMQPTVCSLPPKTAEVVIRTAVLAFSGMLMLLATTALNAQCKPMIKIDGVATVVNENDDFGLSLPYWMSESHTLAAGSSVASISVLEFTVSGSALEFSQVKMVTSTSGETVPSGKVWKIESIAKQNNSSSYKNVTFSSGGTYTWTVPGCAEEICIDMWGAGGAGGGSAAVSGSFTGSGGGGGGYGTQCFAVTPSTTYTIVVGTGGAGTTVNGGTGGTSSVTGTGISMTVTGGNGGTQGTTSGSGAVGTGGTSTATSSSQGASGKAGCVNVLSIHCGAGGAGANGGAGAAGVTSGPNTTGLSGVAPGGGGSGGSYGSLATIGGNGADGKVIISW
jgi:hypothetical protein